MSCTFDKELLTGFYDGELDGSEKAQVESHISACSECLRDLGEIKSAALLVKELPRGRAPRSIAEGVSREIATTGRVHSMARFRKGLLWATSAAAALLIGLNFVYFSSRWSGSDPAPTVMAKKAPADSAMSKSAGFAEVEEGAPAQRQQAGQADFERAKLKEFARRGALADREAENKKPAVGRASAPAKDKGPAPSAEPEPRPKPSSVIAKAESKAGAAPPKPAAAAPPVPRPKPKMAAKPSAPPAAPAPVPARARLGKAAPKSLKKNVEEKAASLDEAARPKNAAEKRDDALRDAKGAVTPKEYLVVATDAAAVRRTIEETIRKWGAAPVRKETEKDLLEQKFRKLQQERPLGPLEVQLTDAQLAELTRALAALKKVTVVERSASLAAGQRQVASQGAKRRFTPPAEAPVPQPEREVQKPAESRNRAAEADAAKGAPAPGAAKQKQAPVRRVIFHFRTK